MRYRLAVLVALLLAAVRWRLRALTFLFFFLASVVMATASRTGWFGVALGCVLGAFFGAVFAYGDLWADAEERRREE